MSISSGDESEGGRSYPLHDAAEAGDMETIRALLESRARARNRYGGTEEGDAPAAEEDEDEDDDFDPFMASLDIDDRDGDGCTALHVSLLHRQLEVLKVLVEAGASVTKKLEGSTPAHIAITMGGVGHLGQSEEVKMKLEEVACEALRVLLPRESNHESQLPLTWKDDRSQTLLHLAAHFGLEKCLRFLLEFPGAKELVNAKERMGLRPLHLAAVGGHLKVISVLLSSGAIVDSSTGQGMQPLHLAVSRGQWEVARALMDAGAPVNATNKQGLTPSDMASKRGLKIPSSLPELGGTPEGDQQDQQHLLTTRVYAHDLCMKHHSCPTIVRSGPEPPPENVKRLHVILGADSGVLTSSEFSALSWERAAPRVQFADVLRVHEYGYVSRLQSLCKMLAEEAAHMGDGSAPFATSDSAGPIAHLDGDTAISRDSFEAAMRAAGAACAAVDAVCTGEARNAFCAIRPPGHHAGPRGLVKCENDSVGSHGFCLLNNVAIAAAYARHVHRGIGIKRVAIVDFDVHHGNGTEEIVKKLVPSVEEAEIQLPFCSGKLQQVSYAPWLNEEDANDCLFVSVHGYGPKDEHTPGWFYPGSGATEIPEMPTSSTSEAGDAKPLVLDVGISQLANDALPGMSRNQWRDVWRKNILPSLVSFSPDIILVSAGFDAHKKDNINFGYMRLIEEDYEWVTSQLVSVANRCCDGRLVSVLEGGYRIQGGPVSAFGRSVASHVRALYMDGCRSKPQWDVVDAEWESNFEAELMIERERKRKLKLEAQMQAQMSQILEQEERYKEQLAALRAETDAGDGVVPAHLETLAVKTSAEDSAASGRRAKRQRTPVDYIKLAQKLDSESKE